MLAEDLIGLLYRREEKSGRMITSDSSSLLPVAELAELNASSTGSVRKVIRILVRRGLLVSDPAGVGLTEAGRREAQRLVRAHRLWEQYLVERAELPLARIHDYAEQFEHYTSASMREALADQVDGVDRDPHGSRIPPEH